MKKVNLRRTVRKNVWIIVLTILVSVCGAALLTLRAQPLYESTSAAFVSTSSAASISDLTQGSSFTQQAVRSYASVATSPYVLSKVISALRLKTSPQALADRVTVTVPINQVILQISATDSSPVQAAAIANSVSRYLGTAVVALTPDSGASVPSVKYTVIQTASVPARPESPDLLVNLLAGLITGAVLAVIIVALREKYDTRLTEIDQISEVMTAPLLGATSFIAASQNLPLVREGHGARQWSESIKNIRTGLQFVDFESGRQQIVITSSIAGEGKSTIAANLAISLAEAGRKVLLIDADLRRPRLAAYMGMDGAVGLVDVLVGTVDFDQAVQAWGDRGLVTLPAGSIPPNPSELLQSKSMRALLESTREKFDIVLLDAPPLLPVTDAAILAKETSGALIIASAGGNLRRQELTAAQSLLDRLGAPMLGFVVTMLRRSELSYAYGYGYGEYIQDAEPLVPAATPYAAASH